MLNRIGPVLKLGDFGLAKELNANSVVSTKLGTPFFMAPEVILDDQYGKEADIFALGPPSFPLCQTRVNSVPPHCLLIKLGLDSGSQY